ncbi:unnamed protein product [Cuscuta epithymum]|uniref:DNA topoisomerase n=1 Tax=Cuscuta epithymum TaxID=186058 RepID=A0AAV0E9Q6_9ASTE|nr:unnamed protein product [Cuscuta epithymum]
MSLAQRLLTNTTSSCLTIMNKAFQNCSAIQLQFPAFGSISKFENLPCQARTCVVYRGIPSRVFASKFEPKLFYTVLPKRRMGVQCNEAFVNVISFGSMGRLGSRSFSHFPRKAISERKYAQSPHDADNKDVNLENSSLPASNKQSPITKGKVKKQPRSKKGNSGSTDVKEDIPQQKKKATKKNQSPAILEISSTVISEVSDGNVLGKQQSTFSKKSNITKEKANKDATALVNSDKADNFSSTSNLEQNQSLNPGSKAKSRVQKVWPKLYPPTNKSVLVVESVTKAKIIQGYLGDMFEVLPSYGHIRDLAARSGSVRPDDDFSMVWEVPPAAWTRLLAIKGALSGAKNIVLASDPDREGEAIAWHIIEMLQQQDALRDDITVARVVFNEITELSIKNALQAPREIDVNLVNAYLARRALDYLIGFNISPLLWRKLPACQSAGRVQSAALALICDREMEIDKFEPQEYWTVDVEFSKKDCPTSANNLCFSSYLTHFDSQKLNQHSIRSQSEANDIEKKITSTVFNVLSSKRTKKQKNPPPPYITSTLQQDAANRLGFTSTYTMRLAQKLYEGIQLSDGNAAGLITYIRTDGLHVSDAAAKGIQSFVRERYGQSFASKTPRTYFRKVKNAQEAHEAIRPTDISRLPSVLSGVIDEDSLKLYTLIWSRTLACQMEPSTIEQLVLDIGKSDQSIIFRSTCSNVEFRGYKAVYEDQETNSIQKEEDGDDFHTHRFEVLSGLKVGDPLFLGKTELNQHHTQHPLRYSEGSLVRKMEELGIGRPSTYASTIKVLMDRNYVTVKSRVLFPEFRGRMVSAFLSHYFSEVADYCFTADMETELDNVSAGLTEWKGLLKDYWSRFSKYCEHASNVHIHQVEKMLEKTYGDFLFASLNSRTCPRCEEGTLGFKVSRFGAGYFIGCDQHPKCKYIAKTLYGEQEEETTSDDNTKSMDEQILLGIHPSSSEKVFVKNGPYGYYVQLGEDTAGHTPKRSSLSQVKDVSSITLEYALDMLRYPVTLGKHPIDGKDIIMRVSLEGFKIRHKRTIATLPKSINPKDVTVEVALKLLSADNVKILGRKKVLVKAVEEATEVFM